MNIEKFKYRATKLYRITKLQIENLKLKLFYRNKNNLLFEIVTKNRKYLTSFDYFLSDTNYKKNNYGIQKRIFKDLNKPIKQFPTYSDLICFFYEKIFKINLNYLEIGCSVLKNVLQIKNYVNNANVVCYDINKINPDLEDVYFTEKNNNTTKYFKGDVLSKKDSEIFNNIMNIKYNFIFSDALHEPDAVYSEFENIYKDSLDSEFIIYYDDLDFPGLKNTVKEIRRELIKSFEFINFYTFKAYGWIGQHESLHLNGILTNIDLQKVLDESKIKIYKFKKII